MWIAIFWLLSATSQATYADWNFVSIRQQVESKYGQLNQAQTRFKDWEQLIARHLNASDQEKLQVVNRFFNSAIVYREDFDIWQRSDYWATPAESLFRGLGDCEDYAIAKYFTLREMGVAVDKLRISYVKALKLGRAHMVLSYYANTSSVPKILDNLVGQIQSADQRSDLFPVYSFSVEDVWMQNGKPRPRHGTKSLSKWVDVMDKMKSEGFNIDRG